MWQGASSECAPGMAFKALYMAACVLSSFNRYLPAACVSHGHVSSPTGSVTTSARRFVMMPAACRVLHTLKCSSLPGGWFPTMCPHMAATPGSLKVVQSLDRLPAAMPGTRGHCRSYACSSHSDPSSPRGVPKAGRPQAQQARPAGLLHAGAPNSLKAV